MIFQVFEGKPPTERATLSGQYLPENITLHQMPVQLIFDSDVLFHDRGYILEYSTIPPDDRGRNGATPTTEGLQSS